jgi:predicted site-specific integrase-resolvase
LLAETVITLRQAATVLTVDAQTAGRYVRAGRAIGGRTVRLEAVRVGGRWRTSREAVARFLEATQPPCVRHDDLTARTTLTRRSERAVESLRKKGIVK